MNIEPMPNVVYVRTESAKAGVFEDDTRAVEFAEVVALGEPKEHRGECDEKCFQSNLHVGDKIFVKSWAIDMVNHNGEWHKFIHLDTNGILAKVKE